MAVNTLTANYEYSRSNIENLLLPIKMLLFKKPKTICQIFISVLEFNLSFEHFGIKNEPHSSSLSELIDS